MLGKLVNYQMILFSYINAITYTPIGNKQPIKLKENYCFTVDK